MSGNRSDPLDAAVALYLDDWVYGAGGRLSVMASGEGAAAVSVVRLRGIDPSATAYEDTEIRPSVEVDLHVQRPSRGSFAATDSDLIVSGAWRWRLTLFPTVADRGGVLEWGPQVAIGVSNGRLVATLPGARLEASIDVQAWSDVELAQDAGGAARLSVTPVGADARYRRASHSAASGRACATQGGALRIGFGFNGKIGGPTLWEGDGLVAFWNFSEGMTTQTVPGRGPRATPLKLAQAPRRAVAGALWTGAAHDWRTRPDHYDAIHFHDDDIADCNWTSTLALTLPQDCESGVYAVRLVQTGEARYAPFFVRPQRPRRLAFLASTLSYLAYGNSLWASPSAPALEAQHPLDAGLMRRFGLSTYSRHRDGSGIGLVSMRRPILNCKPGFCGDVVGGQALLNDDLRIVRWLETLGEPFDVVTDHDLHARGHAAIAGCDVLVTGAHPEYHSAETLDAIAAFQDRGGRLVYLGGNGFYWRVALLSEAPHVMEVRRAESGIRMWAEAPGEYHHQADGGLGGLWRRIGRPPNRLVGVGYSAQGDDVACRPYVKTAAADHPRARFLFDGVEGSHFGAATGLVAAAGYEIDRADVRLGTPAHALIVARSTPFDSELSPVNEERLTHTVLDAEDPLRADMTFFETASGGAVLAAGSVFFAATLTEASGAGRVIANAVRRFLDSAPFALPAADETERSDAN